MISLVWILRNNDQRQKSRLFKEQTDGCQRGGEERVGETGDGGYEDTRCDNHSVMYTVVDSLHDDDSNIQN